MWKLAISFFAILFFLFVGAQPIFAKVNKPASVSTLKNALAPSPSPSPTPSSVPKEVNSFELFWPLASGKTMGESLYSLKTVKEKLRGILIFGKAQKSDYQVFLSTKRTLEAEKLINEGKIDLASKTLQSSLKLLENAKDNWSKAKEANSGGGPEKGNIENQLNNLNVFLNYLSTKNTGDVKSQIDQNGQKIQEFLNSL
ncbi:MAG: hypothetical protein A3D24_02445 [Candidatus Blackburnbacteria bacterium RIFCSPHIGHO2_02_FULL_39_13]|uniref:DUF5667 domain-containing protein n=1 Tax=Candidatus Blackburnbacteria bacterium RIFCSPLOWO2_01_FULL_40_20 TaxID=1797519 RepID=A0A1G1VCS3_9BACT|nr:MAG: hypothetical protein UT38_C0013G0001 [Microgenomates group bacterium GW2011_GWA2_39_19]OGY06881.1 MAG: hypothetical protein A2694_03235 [Candidatus Blackburnbacteria bacterium RIFCSPHIGHO2_01_FULL_40_17]OGY08362.1 MAG: hypothetical protein A3D24_02445 [Candidatus Blackburnbacteria bacterium RIFCSPHIGHO2_02_FULL_39_13]OGY13106.1 MAG: hypothetical protein A3A77_03910 [Candidatus Blackburnbacteria bacterium RIFCSPLOWO2_01_FULL_40_20]